MFRNANDIAIDESNLTTTDVTSDIIDCTNLFGLSIQHIATGTIAGEVVIEVSNDKENFTELASPSLTVSDAGTDTGQLTDMHYRWARIKYKATSGSTNTLKVWFCGKGS